MRQARETAGVSLPALALLLKVSPAKLDALECNRWDLLPDIVFARALASSVCRALKIEVAPVLTYFPTLTAPSMKTDESGINAPFRTPGDHFGLSWVLQLRKPGTLVVLLLIFAALALFLLPSDLLKTKLDGVFGRNGDPVKPITDPVVADSVVDGNSGTSIPDVARQPAVVNQVAAVSPASTVAAREADASPLPVTVEGNGAVVGTLVLKASASSWVEVIDGRGRVQVRKIMSEGEVLGASGEPPLSVVIGRADAIAVEVRGKDFSLGSLTKNNVARFEVK